MGLSGGCCRALDGYLMSETMSWDVFVSHATEDKETVAKPLVHALKGAGLSVWYDQFELRLGDRLGRSINNGLSQSKFGIVILSPAFFKKHWPLLELDALAQKEEGGQKVILPVWHNVTIEEVRANSLLLADRIAVKWDDGLQSVVTAILDVVRPNHRAERLIENKSIAALFRISDETTFLWLELVNHVDDRASFSALIKSSTLQNIEPNLKFLNAVQGLSYEVRKLYFDIQSGELVYELTVTNMPPALWELVRRVKEIKQA